ncbi:MAG: hypothetical protein UGF89_10220 [Acutalibacteraceae bacterium]|nr:hypothetical protein [Acutalibacteraceae bacterium]
MSKKVLAVILSLILAFSVIAVPVGAADISFDEISVGDINLENFNIENFFNQVIDKLIAFVLTYLNQFWPGYDDQWVGQDEYVPEYFYTGEESFDTEVAEGAQWKLGFDGESLLDGIDATSGDYFLAGTLEPIAGRVPVKVIDDQRVRVYAVTDGVSGVVIQAVIDGFGLSRGDVQIIRERMEDFAKKNGVVAINVSVLHQHSCIDTLGMNVPLAQALLFNTGNAAAGGILGDLKVEKNQQFMENLYAKTVLAMKRAVNNMKPGDLYYGYADINELIYDKRDPQSYDPNINRLRFVPEDDTQETWILEAGIHCTMLGAGPDELTADFPYYIERAINTSKYGANVVYVQGAELAITTDCDSLNLPEDMDGVDRMVAYGEAVAERVMAIDNDVKLDPVLNIKMVEVRLDVTNEILTLAAREDVLNPVIVKTEDDYQMITEIGYMELGKDAESVAIFICPGEFEPALIYGGPESGDASWSGEDWGYEPLKNFTSCENVMVFGLSNDQAGYVLKDNEYHSMFTENEEINVICDTAGSTFVEAFMELIASTVEAV